MGGDRLALIAGKMLKIYDLTVHSGGLVLEKEESTAFIELKEKNVEKTQANRKLSKYKVKQQGFQNHKSKQKKQMQTRTPPNLPHPATAGYKRAYSESLGVSLEYLTDPKLFTHTAQEATGEESGEWIVVGRVEV